MTRRRRCVAGWRVRPRSGDGEVPEGDDCGGGGSRIVEGGFGICDVGAASCALPCGASA